MQYFAVALLPALILARGMNDGTGIDNCYETELLNSEIGSLNLCTYNKWNDQADMDELHADVFIREYGSEMPMGMSVVGMEHVQFGYCWEKYPGAESEIDCHMFKTEANVQELAEDTTGEASMSYWSYDAYSSKESAGQVFGAWGTQSDMADFIYIDDDEDVNQSTAKSFKDGCIAPVNG